MTRVPPNLVLGRPAFDEQSCFSTTVLGALPKSVYPGISWEGSQLSPDMCVILLQAARTGPTLAPGPVDGGLCGALAREGRQLTAPAVEGGRE